MYLGINADVVEIEKLFFDVFSSCSREIAKKSSETIGGGF